MGDPLNHNVHEMKASTKIEIQANMIALYEKGYNKVEEFLSD